MAFLDEITINAKAGKGGDGVVRWRREKFIAKGGPSGGDGGRGGNVYIRAVRSLRVLDQYRSKHEYAAENGGSGENKSLKGANGEDIVIDFPVGSVVTNVTNGQSWELLKEGQEIQILKGGGGGFGNEHFKSSTNQTPQEATLGRPGEEAELHIEVSLIADVGLVGLPNAGKSSLLNALTNAAAKVGDYPFTTIDPNLGDLYGFIIADIPGLIEGASEGKGLGDKFLRHIAKTKVILHLVSFEQSNQSAGSPAGMMKAYDTIRKELVKYGRGLAEKDEVILLTKTDTVPEEVIATAVKKFEKLPARPHESSGAGGGRPVFALTLFDDASVKRFKDELVNLLKK